MPKDLGSGFPDPEQFGVAPASLPTGWTGMTPLVPTPADATPEPFVLPPYLAAQQTSLAAQASRALALDTSGNKNFADAGYGNTVIVAASDAMPWEKATAKYVCDGFQDEDEIINALLEGSVRLTSGTYSFSSAVPIYSSRSITGLGDITVVQAATGFTGNVFENDDQASGNSNILLADFLIDANDTDLGNAVDLTKVADSQVRHLHIKNAGVNSGPAIEIKDATSRDVRVHENLIEDWAGSTGIFISNSTHVIVLGNSLRDCFVGIEIADSASYCTVEGNIVSGGPDNGINMAGSFHVLNGNIVFENGEHGILLQLAIDCVVAGNIVATNGQDTDDTYSGIILFQADRNSIQANTIRHGGGATQHKYGINVSDAASNDNLITNNDLRLAGRTAALNDAGTGTLTGPGNNGVHTHAGGSTGGQLDHGAALTGLTDDDHTQYVLESVYSAHGRISLTPGDFWAVEGSPALTNYVGSAGSTQGFGGWAMDGTTDESIRTSFRLPEDWASGFAIRVRFFLAVAAGANEDVRLLIQGGFIAESDTINATGNDFAADVGGTQSVSSGAQYQVYDVTGTPNPTNPITAGDTVFLTIHRNGDAAADDYNSDIVIFAVDIDYTRAVV